jgi:sulfur transfer complex TusBCD TusB component (DsrH family)
MLLVFETHAPSRESAIEEVFGAARLVQERGQLATVILIQEGVLHVLQAATGVIHTLITAGIPVLADRFSLMLRGIDEERLPVEIRAVDMSAIVDLLGRDGVQPLWH